MRIRKSNIPIPESHVAALMGSIALHLVIPLRLLSRQWLQSLLGWAGVATGLLLAGWAVVELGERDVEASAELISSGPYALSRNPMYLGWTFITIGTTVLVNTAWGVLCVPVALIATDRVVRQEEQRLEERFGEAYRRYRARVRRYL